MRWRTVAVALALAVAGSAAPGAGPAHAESVPGANSVTFFHDRWHPERTVVGSSEVIFRTPDPPLRLVLSVAPSGRTAAVKAELTNTSDADVRFPAGVSVDAAVARNGLGLGDWTLRLPALRSLAPGQSVTLAQSFDLPMPGNYVVDAAARY